MIEIHQIERQLIIYDVFRTFEKVTYRDIEFVLRKVEMRTRQRDIKDLTDAGLICVKYSDDQKAYIQKKEPTGKVVDRDNISRKKLQHLNRLNRLAGCMRLVYEPDPVKTYFEMFPEASEKIRQRDFETLRHIGYEAGYSREMEGYWVSNDVVSPYDGYGIYLKDGKLVRNG